MMDDDDVIESAQHLFWLQRLVDVLKVSSDSDAFSLVDDAAIYFDTLDDKGKLDLFIYALGSLVRLTRELDDE
jgi:hypothetical protein